MPTNTSYDPTNVNFFDKTKLNKDANSVVATIAAGTSYNIDHLISDDALIMDSTLLVHGAAKGDYWKMQVIHPVYGVVFEPIHKWMVDFTSTNQRLPKANFPAKIFAGLTMRVVYTSVGTEDVWVALNIDKDKVLE
jgi:hypothetical protein